MQRLVISLALLALAVSGCGASSTSHGPTWQELLAQSRALARKNEATERAEGKNPAQTRARAEAQERRELAANAAQAEATVQAKERQINAEARSSRESEERRRQSEENSPESHHYPAAVRAGFLHGCESTSGHEDAACECAIKRVEAKVPFGRYRQNEAEVREGKPVAFIYSFEYGYCAGSEAVSE